MNDSKISEFKKLLADYGYLSLPIPLKSSEKFQDLVVIFQPILGQLPAQRIAKMSVNSREKAQKREIKLARYIINRSTSVDQDLVLWSVAYNILFAKPLVYK